MYTRGAMSWTKNIDFILLDCLCVEISLFVAYVIRHGLINPFATPIYSRIFFVVFLLNFIVSLFLDTFNGVIKRGYYREFVASIWQCLILFLCTTAYIFAAHESLEYSRITIFLMSIFHLVSSYVTRLIWKKHVRVHMKNGGDRALIVVGSRSNLESLINEIRNNSFEKYLIVGLATEDDKYIGETVDNIPVVASYSSLVSYVTNHWVDEILLSINYEDPIKANLVEELTLMGVTVHINMGSTSKSYMAKQVVGNVGELCVISTSMNTMTPRQYVIKRTMDIVVSLFGCLATCILYLILAPIIKIKSPGPVFYTQMRIGKNGKPFKFYKFRSMYLDADERRAQLMKQNKLNDDFMFKLDFDPRVIGNRIDDKGNKKTGIGEFIRKYSLDEFPQFFNVLKGDMSLVGTRPPLVSEYEKYDAHHKARLGTTPGITGLWQVSGRSNILNFEDVVKLDMQYINNWSIGLDIKILLKTIKVVFKKEGAM